jgi:hypothetical protein
MEVNLTPDTEKKLLDLAATSRRGTDDLIEDAVAGYYDGLLQARQPPLWSSNSVSNWNRRKL